jgi:uncharacterized membrane protein (UPF0127 family)
MRQRERAVIWIVIGFFCMLAAVVLGLLWNFQNSATIRIASQSINARIAHTDDELAKGLSGTDALAEGEGMLFVFDKPGSWPIWMKDMNYPIDILWLDESHQVITIAANISPDTYPQEFRPSKPASFVLELPAGYARKYGIETGTVAAFRSWFW